VKFLCYLEDKKSKLKTHALLLAITPEQQARREEDIARRTKSDVVVGSAAPSNKMRSAIEFFDFIGFASQGSLSLKDYERFAHGHDVMLPPHLVAEWNKGKLNNASAQLQLIAKRTSSQNIHTFQRALSAIAAEFAFTLTADTVRPTKDGKQHQRTTALRLGMGEFAPPIIGAWQVWSDQLETKVRVRDWDSTHLKHAEERASYQLTAWEENVMEDAFETPVSPMPDPDLARREKYDGRVMDSELARLRETPASRRTPGATRDLSFLERLRLECVPGEGYWLYRDVPYDKPRGFGRRYGRGPCNQHCSKGLRLKLGQGLYHNIDIVNSHPTVLLHYADTHGLQTLILRHYIQNRDDVLQEIAKFYELPETKTNLCKFAVLILLNGGSVLKWAIEAECPTNSDLVARVLQDLGGEFARIRDHMLYVTFKSQTADWMKLLRTESRLRLTNARKNLDTVLADHTATPADKATAKHKFNKADRKAGNTALERSCFSICTHELEDQLLTVVDETLRSGGWAVASLIFDGVMIEHRTDANIGLTPARAALAPSASAPTRAALAPSASAPTRALAPSARAPARAALRRWRRLRARQ